MDSTQLKTSRTYTYQELSDIVEAAKLVHCENKAQKDVALLMGKSPPTISRLLEKAKELDIVQVYVRSPPLEELENKFKSTLDLPGHGEVKVVVNGEGVNEVNVGVAAAELLADHIMSVDKEEISLTFSCGRTIRETVDNLILRIKCDETLQSALSKKTLKLYPSSLWAVEELSPTYPHCLITRFALAIEGIPKNIHAYATTLPKNFYSELDSEQQNTYRKIHGYNSIIKEAGNSDIIVMGVGTLDNETYKSFAKMLDVVLPEKDIQKITAEIGYIPIARHNAEATKIEDKLFHDVLNKMVGVTTDQLLKVSKDKNKRVFALAGGKEKSIAIQSLLANPCFDTLVCDVQIAKTWLQSQETDISRKK